MRHSTSKVICVIRIDDLGSHASLSHIQRPPLLLAPAKRLERPFFWSSPGDQSQFEASRNIKQYLLLQGREPDLLFDPNDDTRDECRCLYIYASDEWHSQCRQAIINSHNKMKESLWSNCWTLHNVTSLRLKTLSSRLGTQKRAASLIGRMQRRIVVKKGSVSFSTHRRLLSLPSNKCLVDRKGSALGVTPSHQIWTGQGFVFASPTPERSRGSH